MQISTAVKIGLGELQCSVAIPSSTVSHMADRAECLDPTRVERVIRCDVETVGRFKAAAAPRSLHTMTIA